MLAKFVYMWNEFKDDQRLVNWVKGVESESQMRKITNKFKSFWRFLYSHLLGMCSHLTLTAFFHDPANEMEINIKPKKCDGCKCQVSNDNMLILDVSNYLKNILQAFVDFQKYGEKPTMQHICEFSTLPTGLQKRKHYYNCSLLVPYLY